MVTIEEYGDPLERAIDAMRAQMARPENVAKPTWRGVSLHALFDSIEHNERRLVDAVGRGDRAEAFRRAANVANHAWMVADNVPGEG